MYYEILTIFVAVIYYAVLALLSVLRGVSLNQKMLLYRHGLNVPRERLRLPDTAWDNVLA